MSTAEIISNYTKELKAIELQNEINKSLYVSGLGNLNIIIPLSASQNDSESHCFILNEKEKALKYYSNLCNYLQKEKSIFSHILSLLPMTVS